MSEPRSMLDAYNDGLGDGLVYATAVMADMDSKMLRELLAEVNAKRAALRALNPEGQQS